VEKMVQITRAYKTELDPNNEQRSMFMRCAGVARFVYNWALADRIATYEAKGKSNHYEQKRRFNAIKDDLAPWIREVPYALQEQAFANLDTAYKNFFRRVKGQAKAKGFPRFKSRKRGIGGFTLRGSLHVEEKRIKVPRLGWLRLKESGYLPVADVKLLSVNVSEQAGRWYASLQVERAVAEPRPALAPPIGVDLGITTLATCSAGRTFANPRTLRRYEVRLAYLQREMCRRVKGSKNRAKTKAKVATLHARIAHVRKHTIHQATHYLTAKAKPSVVVIEDLNVSGMLKNRHLSKAISDASFGEFRRQLEYKAAWNGVDMMLAGRWFPSSKTCSSCGSVKPKLRLSERSFACEECGVIIDRDMNAAINLRDLAAKRAASACGGTIKPSNGQSPEKQEPSGDDPVSLGPIGLPVASLCCGLDYATP